MLTLLLPAQSGLELLDIIEDKENLTLRLKPANPQASCSVCGAPSNRVQSCYHRTLADLPWADFKVRFLIRVRRFFCKNPACSRKIFSERLDQVTVPYARRTSRQLTRLQQIGLALGGEAGSDLAQKGGLLLSSADTILRLLRKVPIAQTATPQLLGVDDFALKKGHRYGTVLVNLEKHQPIELLEDRTADTFADWLEQHPGVAVITRDRGGAYAEAARRAAPEALQVSDRFHLLQNLSEVAKRTLENHRSWLVLAEEGEAQVGNAPLALDKTPPRFTAHRQRELARSRARREGRLERYQQVLELKGRGLSQTAIAQQLELDPRTVARYLRAEAFPELAKRSGRRKKIDRYAACLKQRWEEGQQNVKELYRELRQKGYKGGSTMLYEFVRTELKNYPAGERAYQESGVKVKEASLTPRQGAWLLVCEPKKLREEQLEQLWKLLGKNEEVVRLYSLVQNFREMLMGRRLEEWGIWLEEAKGSGLAEMIGFAGGLERDEKAVKAAIISRFSNGQTEGQVTRLKLIRRTMYGRGNFDLLRVRVLGKVA